MALHTNVWGNRSNRGNRVTVGEEASREVWCAESGCSKIFLVRLQNGVLAPSGGYSGYLGYRTGLFELFFLLFFRHVCPFRYFSVPCPSKVR